eukprot:m.313078 g.313078  ORF g.313078 m.313078 type:complete len:311 (-) comp55408_c0_seq3:228-1160(-)
MSLSCGKSRTPTFARARISRRYGFSKHPHLSHFDWTVPSEQNLTTQLIQDCLKKVPTSVFRKMGVCPPRSPQTTATMATCVLLREPIYVAGRYCKYSRDLSQTPWVIEEDKRTSISVQEIAQKEFITLFKADDIIFSASGREDVDVRMLGEGRPFIFEVVNARRQSISQKQLEDAQDRTNSGTDLIELNSVKIIRRDQTDVLAEGADSKTKSYCCVVWLEEDRTEDQLQVINETKNVQLSQRTPIRVLHRRSLADRERCVFKFDISISSPVSLGSRVRLNSFFLLCAACRTSESSPISSSCAFQRKLEPT